MNAGEASESSSSRDWTGLQAFASVTDFFEMAFDAIVAFDSQEQITYWNPAAEQMYGWTAQEALGKTPAELFWPVKTFQEQKSREQRRLRLKRGETLQGEDEACRKDGSVLRVRYATRAIFDIEGKLSGSLTIYRDIDISAPEHAVHESGCEFSILFDKAGSAATLSKLPGGILVDVNEAWVKLFGYTRQEAIGKTTLELNINPDADGRARMLAQLQERGSARDIEMTLRTRSGEWRSFLANLDIVEIDGQKYILNTVQDITKRKRAEQLTKESEERFRNIFNQSPIGIGVYNADGGLVSLNPAAIEMFGITSPEKIVGRTLFNSPTIHEEARRKLRNQEQIREEVVYDFDEIRHLGFYETTRTGVSYFDRIITPLRSTSTDEPFGYLSQVLDITERKRTEGALAQAMQELQMHIDNSPLAVIAFDPEFRIIEWSAGAERMFGWRAEEVLNKAIPDLRWVHEDDVERVASLSADMLAGRASSSGHANRNYRKDGSVIECEWYNSAIVDAQGKLISVRSQVLNVTERKRAEDALYEHQKQLQLLNETLEQKVHEKTEEVRRLASDLIQAVQHERHRISHILHDDLQQRIYAIQMQLTFLHDELQRENKTAGKEISDIEQQLTEILVVTRHLSIDLSPPILRDEGLSHAIGWLAAQMRQRYGLPIELQADGPFAISDEALHVLLFNCVRELLFNVVKHAQASRAVVKLQWVEAGLQIEVRDDGRGFPVDMPEQRASEEMNETNGLRSGWGLPAIRHQLDLFGGRMEIQSEPGAGARVLLIIPVVEGA